MALGAPVVFAVRRAVVVFVAVAAFFGLAAGAFFAFIGGFTAGGAVGVVLAGGLLGSAVSLTVGVSCAGSVPAGACSAVFSVSASGGGWGVPLCWSLGRCPWRAGSRRSSMALRRVSPVPSESLKTAPAL